MLPVSSVATRDPFLPKTRTRHAVHARLRNSFPKACRQNLTLSSLLFIVWSDVAGSHGRHIASMVGQGREKRCRRLGDMEQHSMPNIEKNMASGAQEHRNESREGIMTHSPDLIQELKRRWPGRLTEVLRGGGACMSTCRWVCLHLAGTALSSTCRNLGAKTKKNEKWV
jgi:hypothetical protein